MNWIYETWFARFLITIFGTVFLALVAFLIIDFIVDNYLIFILLGVVIIALGVYLIVYRKRRIELMDEQHIKDKTGKIKIIKNKIKKTFEMNDELINFISEESLQKNLSELRSNTIGGQFYCIAGARESYGMSIMKDIPFDWICAFSYEKRFVLTDLKEYLFEWRNELNKFLDKTFILSNNQESLLLDLYAHEFLHQGQLLRYLYANGIQIPNSWKEFWHLSD